MNDYPSDEQLETIRKWNPQDLQGMMDYIMPLWQYADCGYWKMEQDTYYISTAGWSGNEEIIAAMEDNQIWWMMYWKQSQRGGHYIFNKLTMENLWKDL